MTALIIDDWFIESSLVDAAFVVVGDIPVSLVLLIISLNDGNVGPPIKPEIRLNPVLNPNFV